MTLLGRWAPPILLMGLIYLLSDQPDLSTGLGVIDLVARKLVHAAEYALLAVLWWRALAGSVRPGAALWLAVGISVAYAASDEYHQTFVAGRHGSVLDVGVDALGAGLGALLAGRLRTPGAGVAHRTSDLR